MYAGVPPRMWPTFRSCSISPATAEETHTTAATPSTAATPRLPDTPMRNHQQRGDDQGRERQAGDRVVRRADHAHQVARDGGEEEPQNDHHHGRHDGAGEHAGEIEVQRDHAQERHAQAGEYHLGAQIALGAQRGFGLRARFLQVGNGPLHADGRGSRACGTACSTRPPTCRPRRWAAR